MFYIIKVIPCGLLVNKLQVILNHFSFVTFFFLSELLLVVVVVSSGFPTDRTSMDVYLGSSLSSRHIPQHSIAPPEQVVVLPYDFHPDPGHPDSIALQRVAAALRKKEPIVKGFLVDKDTSHKYLLLKPKKANKVISLLNLPGMHQRLQEKSSKSRTKRDLKSVPHSREKRYVFKIRNIAVPLSIFHYLGFLPMRVPGLPYHVDPGLPDYTPYEPYNELDYPEPALRNRHSGYGYRRRRKFQR